MLSQSQLPSGSQSWIIMDDSDMSKTNVVKAAILIVILGAAAYFAVRQHEPAPWPSANRAGFLRTRSSFRFGGSEELPGANGSAESLGHLVPALCGGNTQPGAVRGEDAGPRCGCAGHQRGRGSKGAYRISFSRITSPIPSGGIRTARSRRAMALFNSPKPTSWIAGGGWQKR